VAASTAAQTVKKFRAKGKLAICLTIAGNASIRPFAGAIIDILEPDNIIFAQVRTGLHLDQSEVDPAGIRHSMHATHRQIDRLVLVHKMNLIIPGDLGRSLDDDPMLGAMEMLLQGQALAWLHDDTFDLVALPGIDRLIIAPGPVGALMFQRLGVIFGFQEIDQLLDAIPLRLVEHQDRIPGGDDNDIVDADDRRQMLVGANMNV
jgi:hypothetical protein